MMKKKLMVVRPGMGQGGADRVTLNLLKNLNPETYDITLVLMRHEGEHLSEVPSYIKIHDCNARNLWFFIFPLRKAIREIKPDIVFSTCGGANIPLSIVSFSAPFRRWRSIISERNILFPVGKGKLKRGFMWVLKFIFYRFVNCRTAVSEGVKEEMVNSLKFKRSSVMVVDNPVVDEVLSASMNDPVDHEWFNERDEVPVILHVGRFVNQKDHQTLIKAFSEVLKTRISRLFLLGDGPLMEPMKKLTDQLGISENVFFGGFDKNPFKYMSRCDVFVLSSLHEGLPGVLIQAMACGAPSISTSCPFGPDEIIQESGSDGILVPVGDVDSIKNAILLLLNNDALRRKIGANGIQSVSRFKTHSAVESYVKAIEGK